MSKEEKTELTNCSRIQNKMITLITYLIASVGKSMAACMTWQQIAFSIGEYDEQHILCHKR